MKSTCLTAIAAIGAAALLTACADSYGRGPAGPYADVDYTGYYDDFYGPFSGGYWGPGDVFYYSDSAGRYHRDRAHHFRRAPGGTGFHTFQGHAPAAMGHGDRDHHGH